MAIRRAQLVADAVAVLCPYCSEPQPNPSDGSEQWTAEDFTRLQGFPVKECVSCDGKFLVASDSKVAFR